MFYDNIYLIICYLLFFYYIFLIYYCFCCYLYDRIDYYFVDVVFYCFYLIIIDDYYLIFNNLFYGDDGINYILFVLWLFNVVKYDDEHDDNSFML